ncbi:phosphatase PAP2 family protein [Schaalia canis]|nr:phosphatase PAP2 family protein [Schaalia canis]
MPSAQRTPTVRGKAVPRKTPTSGPAASTYRARLNRRLYGALAAVLTAILTTFFSLYTEIGQGVDTLMMESVMARATAVARVENIVTGVVSPAAMVVVSVAVTLVALARRRPTLAGRAVSVVLVANLLTQLLKVLLHRPDLGLTTGLANSLPSGHVTVAASVSLALIMVAPAWMRAPAAWLGWMWTALMGITVVAQAWHRPADVLVALLLTGACALILAPIESRDRHVPGIHRAMGIAVAIAVVLALVCSLIALWGIDMRAVASPGSGFGFSDYLDSVPTRERLFAVAGISWIIAISGLIMHEVDHLSGRVSD